MLHPTIALIDRTQKIRPANLHAVAAAINIQVNRDLGPIWHVSGTVMAMESTAVPPLGTWPVYIVDKLPAGEGGYHWMTGTNQPYAEVEAGPGWTVAVSHEVCEMLCDPYGNRLQAGPEIILNGSTQTFGSREMQYLLEVCDPPEAKGYVISAGGFSVPVSDFLCPGFYQTALGVKRDFLGRITSPMGILFGGYISWMDPSTNDMMQITWLDPSKPPSLANLGPATGRASLKEHVDAQTRATSRISQMTDHEAVLQVMGAIP